MSAECSHNMAIKWLALAALLVIGLISHADIDFIETVITFNS